MESDIQTIQKMSEIVSEFVISYGFQFLGAVIVILIGWKVANWISELVFRLCQRTDLDITLSKFVSGAVKTVILVFVGIIALGKFGITMTPFIAALGAVAFGGTFALQGPLSNYGAGLTIILTGPFSAGDTIRVQGVTGVVDEISLAHTVLINEDGEQITIPNKSIIGEVLVNSHENLIVEKELSIAYDTDPTVAVQTILDGLASIADVTSEPKPQVGIDHFGESAMVVGVRYWVPTKRYFEVMYAANAALLLALKNKNIEIAYPKQVVQLNK